jgi:protoporphyrinogen oxidase
MRIAIVGGGMTGMAAAYDFIQAGAQVEIFESGTHMGGLAGGFSMPHWQWSVEQYYHHWFSSDSSMFELIDKLKLSQHLQVKKPTSAVYFKDRFYPLDSLQAIATFPGFNLADVVRFGAVTAHLKYISRWQSLESSTAHRWLIRWYGSKIYKLIWEPLLQGKFGPYYKQVTMAWMWARLKARTPNLVTYRGGFQHFINTFTTHLEASGVRIHLNTPVTQIISHQGQVQVTHSNQKENFDACLITTSPQIFLRLVPDLPLSLKQSWQQKVSLGAIVLTLSLKDPLSPQGYYWYNLPKSLGFPFLALVEHTNFISPQDVGGDHIIYCGDYLPNDDPLLSASPSSVLKRYLPALKKINPHFSQTWIKQYWINRTPYAQPVPFINHSKKIPSISTPLKGIYYAGMSHIYPWDRGTNYAVALGHKALKIILRDLS